MYEYVGDGVESRGQLDLATYSINITFTRSGERHFKVSVEFEGFGGQKVIKDFYINVAEKPAYVVTGTNENPVVHILTAAEKAAAEKAAEEEAARLEAERLEAERLKNDRDNDGVPNDQDARPDDPNITECHDEQVQTGFDPNTGMPTYTSQEVCT